MRFFSEDERPTLVHWYFVPDDAITLDLPTPFRSLNWNPYEEGQPDGLGEVWGADRPWRDGSKVGSSLGSNYCGTAEQWHAGQALPPDPPIAVDAGGTPLCCDRQPVPPANPCANLPPGNVFETYLVSLAGFPDAYPWTFWSPAHSYARDAQDPCLWSLSYPVDPIPPAFLFGELNVGADGRLAVVLWAGPPSGGSYEYMSGATPGAWDGATAVTVPLTQVQSVPFFPDVTGATASVAPG